MNIFNKVSKKPLGRIAFNMKPVMGPWGGSSPFVKQLATMLKRRGYDVCYDLEKPVDVIVLIDPRTGQAKPFGYREIARYKEKHSDTRVLHRINECDRRKETTFMDNLLAEANEIADYTVFISNWLRDYHAERWFDVGRKHSVIYNGADSKIFHPIGGSPYTSGEPLRIVTHHWSNHPFKGFGVYEDVDHSIARGELDGVEFWVIGRWPSSVEWRAAITFPPILGEELAEKLRSCHAYITASLWEPCGMHHVEGAQCGLPLIYHEDGGGITDAGKKYGIGFGSDVNSAIRHLKNEYQEYKNRVFNYMPSGEVMSLGYAEIIQRLMCARDM